MSGGRHRPGDERRRPWAALAIVLLTLLVVVADLKSLRDLREARSTAARLEGRIGEAEQRLADLERRRTELAEGEAALERLAREELGLVKPGEVVIILPRDRGTTVDAEVGRSPTGVGASGGAEGS